MLKWINVFGRLILYLLTNISKFGWYQMWKHFLCNTNKFALHSNSKLFMKDMTWVFFLAANNNRENLFTTFDSPFQSQGVHQTNCKTKTNFKPWIQLSHPIKLKDAFKKKTKSSNQSIKEKQCDLMNFLQQHNSNIAS